MREAIGSSLLLYLIVIFVGLVMLFFVGIFNYSKAYRVKNRIIEIVENYSDYNSAVEEINSDLRTIGYEAVRPSCKSGNLNTTNYDYCIYKVCLNGSSGNNCSGKYYYKITTFSKFQFPIIGSLLKTSVNGETKIMGAQYNY